MKKILLCAAIMVVAVTGYAKQPQFVIKGTVGKEFDGQRVALIRYENGEETETAAAVRKGRFELRGNEYTADVSLVYLGPSWKEKKSYANVILERGRIKVSLDPEATQVCGTPLNDVLQRGEDIEKQYGRFSPEHIAFIKENVRTPTVGRYLLNSTHQRVSDKQFDEIVAAAPELFEQGGEFEVYPMARRILKRIPIEIRLQQEKVGAQYLDIEMVTPEGETKRLSDYVGKSAFLVIDVWASWCRPCIAGMPHMREIYEKYRSRGVEIIGVSVDYKGDKGAWLEWVGKLDMPYGQLAALTDDHAQWSKTEFAQFYIFSGIPYAIIIDREGKIVGLMVSPADDSDAPHIKGGLVPALDRLLAERGL